MSRSVYGARLQEHADLFEQSYTRYLPARDGLQATGANAMHYACEAGGKRIRPVLLMECYRLCGGDPAAALPFAAAIEMIHSYSLVHDDLPCMDNSPLRRGRPSTHAVYGETMALLAGDGLLNRAFETMLKPQDAIPAAYVLNAAGTLADAAGIDGMVGGQIIDLESEGKPVSLAVLEALQRGKTAALLTAACVMGAQLAGADAQKIAAVRGYGENLGLCFQIVDDLLDVTATEQQLGKPVGSDQRNEKTTYVTLLGMEKARALAVERTAAAIDALKIFDNEAEELRQLARLLLERDH